MKYSRRQIIRCSLGLAGVSLVRPAFSVAADHRFDRNPFTLGVASGYPEQSSVVLWTRLLPQPQLPDGGLGNTAIPVDWEIAEDEQMKRIRHRGQTIASPEWAHSVHIEVGDLQPGRDYWYRFTSGGSESEIAHTRTAPTSAVKKLSVAIVNCQHFESGRYAAYAAIARENHDLVVHLGDYIYEGRGIRRLRKIDAPECYSLDDYRMRYATYKSDPELQAAHASGPWIVTSDDHEVDNNYAGFHTIETDKQASFLRRRAAAYKAFYEHMPMPRRMQPRGPHQLLHTRCRFGDIAEFHVLDGRQYRSKQACGSRLVTPCAEMFLQERTMLGGQQERWLQSGLGEHNARWNLLAQQTVFTHIDQQPGPKTGFWNDGWTGYPAARQRLLDFIRVEKVSNPVVLSGDIHAFLANDIYADAGRPESGILATELVTSSVSTPGPPQASIDALLPENPSIHLARSDVRGYTRLTINHEGLNAKFIGIRDTTKADSATYELAGYEISSGRAGIFV